MLREVLLIRINLKSKTLLGDKELRDSAVKKFRLGTCTVGALQIRKLSIDARKKNDIYYVYVLDIDVKDEAKALKINKNKDIKSVVPVVYRDPFDEFKKAGFDIKRNLEGESDDINSKLPQSRPVIVGFGPAGMICAYKLAAAGLKPIVFERGEDVDQRTKTVNEFFEKGKLNPASNVQFGEGGAGTFSDGKIGTMIHDNFGRIKEVFDIFVDNGADPAIKYINKPHIGTDRLSIIVKNIREKITALGGEVRFKSQVTDIAYEDGCIKGVTINDKEFITCKYLVLAIGHSARDTFEMLQRKGLKMERKAFAVGVRVEHPQELISRAMYGDNFKDYPPADYKLTYNTQQGRGVYSFCMCPGGFVVNASSEEGRLCINGMSKSKRDEKTANSALVVEVKASDMEGDDPLEGMRFQRKLEEAAFGACNGKIPASYMKDFINDKGTTSFDGRTPNTLGAYAGADLNKILPDCVSQSLKEALPHFDRIINGFVSDEAIMMGVESRTSSPVRIIRESDSLEALECAGLFPCGEGAGYAGGITSAAVDGLKVYEKIAEKFIRDYED